MQRTDTVLKAEDLTREEENDYGIVSQKEILSVLKQLVEKNARVAVYSGDMQHTVITVSLGASESGLLLRDPDNEDSRFLAENKNLVVVSQHMKVKIQFKADRAIPTRYQGLPILHLPLPDRIYRIQRRAHFRLTPPPFEPLYCLVSAAGPQGQPRKVAIADISAGGLRLTFAEKEIDLAEGRIYKNCQIRLPGVAIIDVTLMVRSLFSSAAQSGQMVMHAGCQFQRLDGATHILLQRYITDMQRKIGKRLS